MRPFLALVATFMVMVVGVLAGLTTPDPAYRDVSSGVTAAP